MLICVLSLAIPVVLGLLWLIFKIGDICYDKAYDKYHHLRWEDYKKENDPELELARKNLDMCRIFNPNMQQYRPQPYEKETSSDELGEMLSETSKKEGESIQTSQKK